MKEKRDGDQRVKELKEKETWPKEEEQRREKDEGRKERIKERN